MRIEDLVKNVRTLCITGHVRPDGDCVGSILALYLYLEKNHPGVKADIYLEDPGEKLAFLKGYEKIVTDYPDHEPYDLMICLDAASFDRIGKASKYFKTAKKTVNIDHHVSNTKFADENYVNGASSSASEEIYKFMDPDKLDEDIAISLYTGIVYDTGVFKYSSTSPKTMEIVSKLMEYDIPCDEIIDKSFYAMGYNETRIFGYALMNSKIDCDGRLAYTFLSQKEINDFGVTTAELDGIVPQLRLITGVDVALFAYESSPDDVKVSLRSTPAFNVNKIAVSFGGGGHVAASGANLKGSLKECVAKVLEAIKKEL